MGSGGKQIIYGILGLILVLVIMTSVYTAGGNLIGELILYLLPLVFLVSFIKPRVGLYMLVISSVIIDTVKRLMILDISVGFDSVAAVQAIAPALAAGAILKTILRLFSSNSTMMKGKLKMFISLQIFAVMMGLAYLFSTQASLHGLGIIANSSIYISLIACVPFIFPRSEDCLKLFKLIVILYIPVSLWAIKQAIWGLADYEMNYLLSGLTIEIRQLGMHVFRNMGTLASAPAMSYTSSILAAAMIIPLSLKKRKITFTLLLHPVRIIAIVIFVMGAYYTFTRTGWLAGVLAVAMFTIIKSRFLVYSAIATGVVSLGLLIVFSQTLVDSKILNKYQAILRSEMSNTAEGNQVMVLGTINGRLESLANLTNNPEVWTPFGVALAGGDRDSFYAHDAVTEMLVLVGYIPLLIIILTMIITFVRFYGRFYRLDNGASKLFTGYFLCLGIGVMLVGFGHLQALFVFPANMFWALFLGFGISHYFIARQEKEERIRSQEGV